MIESEFTTSRYRWIILILFMLVNISTQILWISYAPVTLEAVAYYNVSEFEIILISTIYMIIYIPVSFFASWSINKYGFRAGVGLGAIINGIFGFLRYTAGPNYTLVLIFTIIIAISQPIILNSITLLSASWFPLSERTTATGISLNSLSLGVALGMVLTPLIVVNFDIPMMLFIYGLFSLIVGIFFIIFAKNGPGFSPFKNNNRNNAISLKKEIKLLISNKLFWIIIILFFISLGLFNWVTTYIELIVAPRGLSSIDAGVLGAILLVGGMVGTIILAFLSDRLKRRRVFIISAGFIAAISITVLTFANNAVLFNIFGFLLGFGLLSAGPLVLEYAVEITNPVPEASSNGFLMVVGQIGGIIFILGFEKFVTPTGDYLPSLIILSILTFISLLLSFRIKDVNREILMRN